MFVAALLCQAILATAAFGSAVPTAKERLARRAARRAAGLIRQSLPPPVVSEVNGLDNATQTPVAYSTNWAGAFLSEKTATYKEVSGTFLLPTPKVPSGGSGAYQASAWVGIDGATCVYSLLEAGVDFVVNGSSVSYHAWYHWDPAGADFEDIALKAGDIVTVTVEATSKTNGTAWIKNHTTGKRVSHNFTGQPSLCQHDAEWVIEELGSTPSTLAPLANFTKVIFTHATAYTLEGKPVSLANAEQMDILKSNKAITKVTTGADSVTITYTGQ